VLRILAFLFTALVGLFTIALSAAATWQLGSAGPKTVMLKSLTVTPSPGLPVTFGRKELMQPDSANSAELQHIVVLLGTTKTAQENAIFIRKIAKDRNLLLGYETTSANGIPDQHKVLADRWEIAEGDDVRFTDPHDPKRSVEIHFDQVGERSLRINIVSSSDRSARALTYYYDGSGGSLVTADGNKLPVEVDQPERYVTTLVRTMLAGVARIARSDRGEIRLIAFGNTGGKDIRDHSRIYLNVPMMPFQAMWLDWRKNQWFLSPGRDADRLEEFIAFRHPGQAPVDGFGNILWPIDHPLLGKLASIIAGRTTYAVTADGRRLLLRPEEKIPLFKPADAPLRDGDKCGIKTSQIDVQCTPPLSLLEHASGVGTNLGAAARNLWGLTGFDRLIPRGLVVAVAGIALLAAFVILRSRRIGNLSTFGRISRAGLLVALTGVSCALSLTDNLNLTIDQMPKPVVSTAATFVNLLLATLVVAAAPLNEIALRLMWLAVLGLTAIGSVTLLAVGAGGDGTQWLIPFVKHKALFVDLVPPCVILLVLLPSTILRDFAQWALVRRGSIGASTMRWSPILVLLCALLAWEIYGDDQGLNGIQPVEFAKIGAAMVAALLFVRWNQIEDLSQLRTRHWMRDIWGRIPRRTSEIVKVLAAATVCAMTIIVVPFSYGDFSPILIIVITVGAIITFELMTAAIGSQIRVTDRRRQWLRLPEFFIPQYVTTVRFLGRNWWNRLKSPVPRRLSWQMFALGIGVAFVVMVVELWPFAVTWEYGPVFLSESAHDQAITLLGPDRDAGKLPQRFAIWRELSFDRKTEPDLVVHFKDLTQQVRMSRCMIAKATCAPSEPLLPNLDLVTSIANATLGYVDRWIAASPLRTSICTPHRALGACPKEKGDEAPPAQATSASTPVPTNEIDPASVPLVQKDFVAAFAMARLGLGIAVVFFLLQALLLILAAYIVFALKFRIAAGLAERATLDFLALLTLGVATILAMQWAIAWSNALGLLPVMGQPMSFMAQGESHHVLLILPCIIVLLCGARFVAMPEIVIIQPWPPQRGMIEVFLARWQNALRAFSRRT
jgi:hypothetical protein